MKKVLLGMSGGVDSSTAALLLLQQGYEVAGATFRVWKPAGAESEKEIEDAGAVCERLGIRHYLLDLQDFFRETVVEYFVHAYQQGMTPNPCVVCNRTVKFGRFFEAADALGYDMIATGHYARILQENGEYQLCRGVDRRKDQSYFLYGIPYARLPRIVFPLGDYTKTEVRELAGQYGLTVSEKKDSQEICFVDPQQGYASFLQQYTGQEPQPGDFLDTEGNRLGRHSGIWHYTVGQRKGLGVTFGKPMFVQRIVPAANQVILAENQQLFTEELWLQHLCWALPAIPEGPLEAAVKIRSTAQPVPAVLVPDGEGLRVRFAEPQRAATPGQSAVFYRGDRVLGGGVISG
ncbi:MAG TPA: tRNA 2-thiouridine(34) synthase MnmA [Firmicutes bacterium]|nr:tRNA 2-thiouridine(34) synthase MnmA [Bacillota bacterium]